MQISNAVVATSIDAAFRRVDAIEVLCSIITGQPKAERRALQAIRSALVTPVSDSEDSERVSASDISIDMLG